MPANRRHHATSDHDFSPDESEFLAAIEAFKARSGKRFPTWTDCLGVLIKLGYVKITAYPDEEMEDLLEDCAAA